MTAKASVDDAQLIRQIARGDRQALSELYARYQRSLFAYLLQFTPDYGLAEELLQDTLVAVWKSARSFGERSSVLTWLIGIAPPQAWRTVMSGSCARIAYRYCRDCTEDDGGLECVDKQYN